MNKHVKNLRTTGWHIEAVPRRGMMLMSDSLIEDAPVTPPAPAPVTTMPDPEPPADEAPAPGPEIPLEPVLAAGEYTTATPEQIAEAMMKPRAFANLTRFEVHGHSRPVRIICELDEMDEAEREAVLQLAVSLWWLK